MEPYMWETPWFLNWPYQILLEFVTETRTRFGWQSKEGQTASAKAGDVQSPKEKPRPPCEAVYKSTFETR